MAIRIRRYDIAVPLIALILVLIAAGLSFLAFAKRIKIEDVTINKKGLCIYPNSPAFAVGILAAIFIIAHQLLISAGTGCFCCGRNKFPCNLCGIIAFILFVLSWLSVVITLFGLIDAIINIDKSFLRSKKYTAHKKEDCHLPRKQDLFSGVAIWCFIIMFFSLSSYAMFMCGVRKHRNNDTHRQNSGP